MTSKFSLRVYYEDTDSGGVVYYANYLKFAERARTEALRTAGINQSMLAETDGILFVVRHVEMDLLKPARLDDMLDIVTKIEEISGPTILMSQDISCGDKVLSKVKVKVVCVSAQLKPMRLPDNIKEKMLEL